MAEIQMDTLAASPKAAPEPVPQTPGESPRAQTEVFAVHGADPEVLAYAMAKYSRSSLSMKEALAEISSQRAEQFLNTFYFQYGHRSIADLAHVAFAIERLSLLAAIILVDEQRWDGQERSTRYQNFRKSGWYLPDFAADSAARGQFSLAIEALFAEYHTTAGRIFDFLKERTPKPAEMKEEAYARTLRARAFDVARYLLPLATNTSLGQIVNARTLESQISRLLSSPHAEIRQLGERLREAAAGSAWNVQGEALASLTREIAALDPSLGARAEALLSREVKTAPTLVNMPCKRAASWRMPRQPCCRGSRSMPLPRLIFWKTKYLKSKSRQPCFTGHATIPTARSGTTSRPSVKNAAPRSCRWGRSTEAGMTSCSASFPPATRCASTS